jgi:hypothetical protein
MLKRVACGGFLPVPWSAFLLCSLTDEPICACIHDTFFTWRSFFDAGHYVSIYHDRLSLSVVYFIATMISKGLSQFLKRRGYVQSIEVQ